MASVTLKAFAKAGYRVFALDLRVGEAIENVIPIEGDVTSEESLEKALRIVSSECDRLFAILHFAGIYMLNSLVEMPKADFERIFRINLGGAYLVNKIFLPLLGRGSKILITTSELAPLDPLPFTGVYAVSKAALDGYAYSLRMELQLLGISVSVLRAGAVSTDMLGVSTDALDRFCSSTALYRCNAARFKRIVDSVEARCVSPEAIAKKAKSIVAKKNPRFAYAKNRNPLLLLLNLLPRRMQLFAIRCVLKDKKQ